LTIEKACEEECLKNPEFSLLSKSFGSVVFSSKLQTDAPSDLVVTIGGDGTIVWALKYFGNTEIPPIITFDATVTLKINDYMSL
jgi:NAD kinase